MVDLLVHALHVTLQSVTSSCYTSFLILVLGDGLYILCVWIG